MGQVDSDVYEPIVVATKASVDDVTSISPVGLGVPRESEILLKGDMRSVFLSRVREDKSIIQVIKDSQSLE